MSSSALVMPGSDGVIAYRSGQGSWGTVDSSSDTTTVVLSLQAATGRLQALKPSIYPRPSSPWFERLWTSAFEASSGALWETLPERVFDEVDEHDRDLDPLDGQFLAYTAVSEDVPAMASLAAIRLLGILAEEGKLDLEALLPTFRDLIGHPDPMRRYHGVMAVWQARAREALPVLRRRLEREAAGPVRDVLVRAIAVLE